MLPGKWQEHDDKQEMFLMRGLGKHGHKLHRRVSAWTRFGHGFIVSPTTKKTLAINHGSDDAVRARLQPSSSRGVQCSPGPGRLYRLRRGWRGLWVLAVPGGAQCTSVPAAPASIIKTASALPPSRLPPCFQRPACLLACLHPFRSVASRSPSPCDLRLPPMCCC